MNSVLEPRFIGADAGSGRSRRRIADVIYRKRPLQCTTSFSFIYVQPSTTVSRRNINFYYLLNDWRDQPLHFAIVFQSPWRTWNQEQICRATIYLSVCAVLCSSSTLCRVQRVWRYLHYGVVADGHWQCVPSSTVPGMLPAAMQHRNTHTHRRPLSLTKIVRVFDWHTARSGAFAVVHHHQLGVGTDRLMMFAATFLVLFLEIHNLRFSVRVLCRD